MNAPAGVGENSGPLEAHTGGSNSDVWQRTEAMTMSMEENKAIVRTFLEALDEKNFDALKEHPGLYQTVERQLLIRDAFPDLQTTIERQIAEGDTVATRATLRGTHLGPFHGSCADE
jgi:predicted ester cyclase